MSTHPWSQDLYVRACTFAATAHHGQTLPGSELPYSLHVNLVSMEVSAALRAEPRDDEDLAVQCALLHDVIEDTQVSYEQVLETFGLPVAQGVLALTKDATLEKSQQMADSLRRIQQQPQAVWMVKLADRINNLEAPPHYWTAEKIAAYRSEAGQILEALGSASAFLAARLREKIAHYPPPR